MESMSSAARTATPDRASPSLLQSGHRRLAQPLDRLGRRACSEDFAETRRATASRPRRGRDREREKADQEAAAWSRPSRRRSPVRADEFRFRILDRPGGVDRVAGRVRGEPGSRCVEFPSLWNRRLPAQTRPGSPMKNRMIAVGANRSGNGDDVEPVRPGGEVDLERDVQVEGRGHRVADELGQRRRSPRRGPRRPARRGSGGASGPASPRSRIRRSTREHGPLDQVGGRALDHGVDGRPLGQVAVPAGRVLDPVDRPAAAEDRLDPAGRQRRFEGPGDERVDAGVFLEVGVDERGGLGLGDPQPGGQAERARGRRSRRS